MSFEDDLAEQLAKTRYENAQRELAAENTERAALKALERLQAKCADSAKFLTAHGVPPVPFVSEVLEKSSRTGPMKVEQAQAMGWYLNRHAPTGMGICTDGSLWETHRTFDSGQLTRSAPFSFDEMRRLLSSRKVVKAPVSEMEIAFPRVYWHAGNGFSGDENANVQYLDNYERMPTDLEAAIAEGVVRLVLEHSG